MRLTGKAGRDTGQYGSTTFHISHDILNMWKCFPMINLSEHKLLKKMDKHYTDDKF